MDKIKRKIIQFNKLKDIILSVEDFCDKKILTRENTLLEIPTVVHKTILQFILSKQPMDLLFDTPINTWDVANNESVKINNAKLLEKTINIQIQDHHIATKNLSFYLKFLEVPQWY